MIPPPKKKADHQALASAWMRVPRLGVEAARDLLDLGFTHPDQIAGRCPESLFTQLQKMRPQTPPDRVRLLRLAVYVAEQGPNAEKAKLHPDAWR